MLAVRMNTPLSEKCIIICVYKILKIKESPINRFYFQRWLIFISIIERTHVLNSGQQVQI